MLPSKKKRKNKIGIARVSEPVAALTTHVVRPVLEPTQDSATAAVAVFDFW